MTKLNRRSRFDDVLFAIAVLVPVVCATARFVDSERAADVIVQAQQNRSHDLQTAHASTSIVVAQAAVEAR